MSNLRMCQRKIHWKRNELLPEAKCACAPKDKHLIEIWNVYIYMKLRLSIRKMCPMLTLPLHRNSYHVCLPLHLLQVHLKKKLTKLRYTYLHWDSQYWFVRMWILCGDKQMDTIIIWTVCKCLRNTGDLIRTNEKKNTQSIPMKLRIWF